MAMSTGGEPDVLPTVKHDGEDIDVIIEVEKKEFDTIDELTAVELETPFGTTVEIADVVDVIEGKSPETIQRRDGKMYASISADILTKDVAGISSTVEKEIEKLDLPSGIDVRFDWVTEQINESFT